MAQIWKNRARKPTAEGLPSCGYYSSGIGGALLNVPCIMFGIDDHRLVMSINEFKTWCNELKKLDPTLAQLMFNQE